MVDLNQANVNAFRYKASLLAMSLESLSYENLLGKPTNGTLQDVRDRWIELNDVAQLVIPKIPRMKEGGSKWLVE